MPSVKQKIEEINSQQPAYSFQDMTSLANDYTQWLTIKSKIADTTEALAYRSAQCDLDTVNSELNKARQERDKLQKTVEQLESKLKVCQHIVTVLGSVEVP